MNLDKPDDDDPLALVHRLAHELKNAAWGLSGFTDLALRKLKKADHTALRRDLANLRMGGLKLLRLLREIDAAAAALGGAAPEAVGPDAVPEDLHQTWQRVAARLCEEDPSRRARLDGLKAGPVRTSHRERTAAILEILARNALEYTDGPVRLTAQQAGEAVRIQVEDEGASRDRSRWLEPFFTDGGTTGVGLPLAALLAADAGGELVLGEAASGGTAAAAHLAGARAGPDPEAPSGGEALEASGQPAPRPEVPAAGRAEAAGSDPCERVVIYMDDQRTNRRLIERVLVADGWTVHTAPDGLQGLELALSTPADLILVDLHMPEMDGLSVARELRRKAIPTPVVGFTASEPDEVLSEDEYRTNFEVFVNKGTPPGLLPCRLRESIAEHTARERPADVAARQLLAGLSALQELDDPGRRRSLCAELRALIRGLRTRLAPPAEEAP